MSWSYSLTDTPAKVKQGFESYNSTNPLQGHEKVARGKIVDLIVEAGKGFSADFLMNFVAFGSAYRVDGVEVQETISVSITPVAVE